MQRRRLRTPAFFLASAITLLVGGCGSNSSTTAAGLPILQKVANLEKTTLNVSVLPSIDSAGFFVALHDGLFTQVGLRVNYTPAQGDEVMLGQMKGQYDITGGSYVNYITRQVAGQTNLRIFAEGSLLQPGSQVLMTTRHSHITSLDKLRGHVLGVNRDANIGYLLVAEVLAEHGIPLSTATSATAVMFPKQPIDFFAMGQALVSGQVDAAIMPEPLASEDASQYGLLTIADLNQGATDQFPVEGYAVTPAWARANPNTLRAFYIALEAGQQVADTNRGAVEAALTSLKSPQDGQVSRLIASMVSLNNYPLGLDPSRLQRTADVMLRLGLVTRHFNINSILLPIPQPLRVADRAVRIDAPAELSPQHQYL
jgi:NitT/TauT family transport system substrate-binding protein